MTEQEAAFVVAKKWCASRPEFLRSERNEALMFAFFEEHELPYDRLTSYEEAFANLRNQLDEKKPVRRTAPAAPRVINGIRIAHDWDKDLTAEQMGRVLQNPRVSEALNKLPKQTR